MPKDRVRDDYGESTGTNYSGSPIPPQRQGKQKKCDPVEEMNYALSRVRHVLEHTLTALEYAEACISSAASQVQAERRMLENDQRLALDTIESRRSSAEADIAKQIEALLARASTVSLQRSSTTSGSSACGAPSGLSRSHSVDEIGRGKPGDPPFEILLGHWAKQEQPAERAGGGSAGQSARSATSERQAASKAAVYPVDEAFAAQVRGSWQVWKDRQAETVQQRQEEDQKCTEESRQQKLTDELPARLLHLQRQQQLQQQQQPLHLHFAQPLSEPPSPKPQQLPLCPQGQKAPKEVRKDEHSDDSALHEGSTASSTDGATKRSRRGWPPESFPVESLGSRNAIPRVIVFGGYDGSRRLDTTEMLSVGGVTFEPGPRMRHGVDSFGVVLLDPLRVLVIGGDDGSRTLYSTSLFDLVSLTFRPGPNMLAPRSHACAVLLDRRRVLVAGGCAKRQSPMASTEILDVGTMTFSPGPDLLHPRSNCSMVLLNDQTCIVVGGKNQRSRLETTELLDLSTMLFRSGPSMLRGRASCAAAMLDRTRMIVVGGSNGIESFNTTEVLDARRMAFTQGPPMQLCRSGCMALVHVGRLLVLGGVGKGHRPLTTEHLDLPELANFELGPKLCTPRVAAAAVSCAIDSNALQRFEP